MNKKWLPFVLVVVLAVALFLVRRSQQGREDVSASTKTERVEKSPADSIGADSPRINRNRGFDRRVSYIEYTRHASCRMDCRRITKREVEEIMRDGEINYKKSRVQAKPCPEYALEGTTGDGQHVRIVFAQCDQKTKVVTTIDLKTEWTCDCPGDKH